MGKFTGEPGEKALQLPMHILDDVDKKILAELKADARIPLTTLSRRVGRSRTAVQMRIERLEREGVILGYETRLASDGGDSRRVGAIITFYLKDRLNMQRVVDALKLIPELIGCYVVTGEADIVATFSEMTRDRLEEVCEPLWALPDVRETNTVLVLKAHLER